MVKGAILGIVCSLLVAFLILVLTTMNWWTAALGLLNICAEVCVFLGLLPVIGWSLGEYECIFMIATVGLSVDYTVHLLHAYNHSHAEDRISRGKAAMGEMGMSVLNSAITTLLAAFILFFCGFYFFFQFGAFLFIVIFVSIIMSMTFLMPIIMMIGPERDQGRLAPIYRRITGKGS
jgi:predicted RND superfamily exporter protein